MIERLSGQSVAYSARTSSHDNVDTQKIKDQVSTDNFQKETVGTIEVKKEKLDDIIDGMNEFLQPSNTSLKFELHEKLNEYYVTIVDDITHEVVKEIPSKKMLDMYAAMTEFVGLMVDKKI
ncbi:flagellar protein FlaG [Bacillus sp. UMB0728]|uniref:flagellar protein FlaG n=1 Tax=Bacillus sp. UMB0728 TaxID=2066052 RepID=UPI000C759551|nr:flagellar protein FlaG [Bacillus sp. UMB0728]PLR73720.1 flagellar biosynthesis protein FlaG [Bacillus sp. UMB0728]